VPQASRDCATSVVLPVVVEYSATGLTWAYGTGMIGTHVCLPGLQAAGNHAVLARSAGPVLIAKNAEMRARLGGARQARTRRQRGPSAICLWAPQYYGLQRAKVTHAGTEEKRSEQPRIPASEPFPPVVAGVGFERADVL
jgi:hypothetical protein